MSAAPHGISLTSAGQLVVKGDGFQVALQLTTDELREMSVMLDEVADRLEADAASIVDAAFERAQRGPLQ